MKAEFLQNFKVGDAPLPNEVIEAILAENGRDVEEAKKPFADYDSIKEQLRTATEGLEAFKGVDHHRRQGPQHEGHRCPAGRGRPESQQGPDR